MRGDQDRLPRSAGGIISLHRRGSQRTRSKYRAGHRGTDGSRHSGRRSHGPGAQAIAGVLVGCLDAVCGTGFILGEASGASDGAGRSDGRRYAGGGCLDGEGGGGEGGGGAT